MKDRSYTVREEYLESVKNKLQDVLLLCQIHRIPFFATIATEDDGTHTTYQNYVHSAAANHIPITDDEIRKHILVAKGFTPVPKREAQTFAPFEHSLYGEREE